MRRGFEYLHAISMRHGFWLNSDQRQPLLPLPGYTTNICTQTGVFPTGLESRVLGARTTSLRGVVFEAFYTSGRIWAAATLWWLLVREL